MSDKKKTNLAAFLNKNKKKGETAVTKSEPAISKNEQVEKPVDDAPVNKQKKENNPEVVKNAESSDEEVDETEVIGQKQFGKITQGQTTNKNDTKNVGFGFTEEEQKVNKKEEKKVKAAAAGGEIKFGGKPTFGRGNNRKIKFGNDNDFQGLDDLEENQEKKKPVAESKPEEKKAAEKPRFRGKLNLMGTGGQEQEAGEGVKTNYGFEVKYKSEIPDGEKRERHDDDNKERGERGDNYRGRGGRGRGGRGGRGGGMHNGWGKGNNDDDQDEGFQIVQNKDAKRRQQRGGMRGNNEDSDDSTEGAFNVTRGGNRGGRERGGGNIFRNNE